ncbi:MAG: 3-phosphoshikimate 1-carboxyvinyltransferase [Verrucomicrobia bacterium]|nr:3-phosphoshikimate 1-carboxyvinyltransferase [Verrucomicrobiota bacterium]
MSAVASSLPAQLPVIPFVRPVAGTVEIPGSKSLTNRALLLAALCDAPVALTGALFSDDTRLMAGALRELGYTVIANETAKTLYVAGQGEAFQSESPVELFVGLAGTAARFLTALCAAAPRGVYRIQGTERMNQRPMKGLIEALRALGAEIRCLGIEGFFPIEIYARGLRGGEVAIDATESSQMLSALLMIAPRAAAPVEVSLIGGVRWPFVEMTTRFMEQFGQPALERTGPDRFRLPAGVRYVYPGKSCPIEPDATAASYYAALPLVVGGELTLLNLREGLQGDTRFVGVMAEVGLGTEVVADGLRVSFAKGAARGGVTRDFSGFSDTFLTLAAISPLLTGPTTITGVAHTRKQETDRVAGMVAELRRLGQAVHEHEDGDGLTITPNLTALRAARGVVIQTYHDHRFAMSFGILGSCDLHGDGKPWLTIDNPACCAKTFPNFFEVLETLRTRGSV